MHVNINIFIRVICGSLALVSGAYAATQLEKVAFPASSKDISHADKMELLTADYKNYEGLSPYEIITIEQLEQTRKQDEKNLSHQDYCQKYPLVPECDPTPEIEARVMSLGDNHENTSEAYPQGLGPADTASNTVDNNQFAVTDNTATVQTSQAQQTQTNYSAQNISAVIGVTGNNNSATGACTPSQRNAYFDKNDWHKLTTHRYDQTNPVFAKAMFNLLRVERPECHNFSRQYGGMTCYGYTAVSNPDIDVTKLTLSKAEDRTYRMFYTNTGINKLPNNIMGDVMHVSFWRGTSKGVKALYTVLGLSCGRRCDRVTDELVRAAKNYSGDLHNKYWDQVWAEVKSYPSNRPYLKGFGERVKLARENGCYSRTTNPINF